MDRAENTGCRRTRVRGFTLIELLVAVVAGLLVAAAAVSFSRQSTRFFAQETRIASAQMSVLAGFQRLQADLSRAAYMSTTDMMRDKNAQRLCAPEFGAWPAPLQQLTSVSITSTAGSPDTIRVVGNLASSEMFPVRAIESDGGGHTVYLQVNNGPMTRAGFIPGSDASDAAFQNVFRPGRLIRILDDQGKYEFEVIKASSYTTVPSITTFGPLPLRGELSMAVDTGNVGATSAPCGIGGFGVGVLLNPVSVVQYSVAKLADVSPYKDTIYHADYAVTGADENRTELVRSELLFLEEEPGEGELSSLTVPEIVAEFAVDLRVGVWSTDNTVAGGVTRGGVTYYAPGTAAATTGQVGEDDPLTPVVGPTAIRSLDLRLVVRSREADRAMEIDNEANPLVSDGFMFRAPMPNGRWARARTLTANVTLMNHRGDAW